MMFKTLTVAAIAGLAAGATTRREDCKTIAEIGATTPGFKTLVAAVTAAGLVDELSDPNYGPVTVFAPTDKAFGKIPKATLDAVIADPETLTNILTYHVVAGEVLSSSLKNNQKVKMANGDQTTIRISGKNAAIVGGTPANRAKIGPADIVACNGVVHVIDTVLIPPADK